MEQVNDNEYEYESFESPTLIQLSNKFKSWDIDDSITETLLAEINNVSMLLSNNSSSDNVREREEYLENQLEKIFDELVNNDDLSKDNFEDVIHKINDLYINDTSKKSTFNKFKNNLSKKFKQIQQYIFDDISIPEDFLITQEENPTFMQKIQEQIGSFISNHKQKFPALGIIAAFIGIVYFHSKYSQPSPNMEIL